MWYFLRKKYLKRLRTHARSATVRYAFPAVVFFSATLAAVLSSGGASDSYVRVDTRPETVAAGDMVTISVYAHAAVPINAVDITIAYPERQLKVEGIDVGESVITIWTEEPYARDGAVHLRGGVFRRGFLGEHLIARIQARAQEGGVTKILTTDSQFIAGDGKGTIVDVMRTGAEETQIRITKAGELKSTVSVGVVTDIDGDGDVDMSDIRAFLEAWQARRSAFDFNGDGRMTFRDFGILLAHSFMR